MAAMIPDERSVVLASNIFFFQLEMPQSKSGTSADGSRIATQNHQHIIERQERNHVLFVSGVHHRAGLQERRQEGLLPVRPSALHRRRPDQLTSLPRSGLLHRDDFVLRKNLLTHSKRE